MESIWILEWRKRVDENAPWSDWMVWYWEFDNLPHPIPAHDDNWEFRHVEYVRKDAQ